VYSPTGQEYVWAAVLAQFGVTEADLQEWFTGPAFLSWFRMGNIEGKGRKREWLRGSDAANV
jgi:hypothetical protein